MIVECYLCEAKVDARVIAEHKSRDSEDDPPHTAYLLECPQCKTTLLAGQYAGEPAPERIWPVVDRYLSHHIPDITRESLEEARRCFKAKAYTASTVMAGRALEGICRHYGAEKVSLGKGIRQLRDQQIIDARLGAWAEELQKARNLGAHASGEKVSKVDARDLLDFVEAICEYVFVLTKKFETFMVRQAVGTKPSATVDRLARTEPDDQEDVESRCRSNNGLQPSARGAILSAPRLKPRR